ncbi:MAG TPA: energy-coupling factor ABC transporter ATP-binding protein, partial [Clostridia bacterium]|nr:energy-coupling factor ABC transporter ATP-binding protein [Clostridia bacterium]
KYNATIIMVSHNMDDIARVATKVAVMNKGKLAMYGPCSEVFGRIDELRAMGLGVPKAAGISDKLIKAGKNIPFCLDINRLAESIVAQWRKKC